MAISVSSSIRQSVSGSPISLFWLPSATTVRACGGAERAEDVLRGGLRRRAGDGDDPGRRAFAHGPPERAERAEGVLRIERGRRAAPRARRRTNVDPAADRDEEVAGAGPPRVDRHPADLLGARRALEPARRERCDLVERERDHAAAPRRRRASRATSRSSNGIVRSRELLALLVALAGDDDDVALAPPPRRRARSRRRGPARPPRSPSIPARISSMIASGSSLRGLSEVTIATSARRVDDRAHERALGPVAVAAAAEDADAGGRRRADAPPRARSRAPRACARSRRARRTAGPRRPARSARARRRRARRRGRSPRPAMSSRRAGRDSAEDVLDVEAAPEPRPQREAGRPEAGRGRRQLELVRADLGVVGEAEGEDARPRARAARPPAGGRTGRRR